MAEQRTKLNSNYSKSDQKLTGRKKIWSSHTMSSYEGPHAKLTEYIPKETVKCIPLWLTVKSRRWTLLRTHKLHVLSPWPFSTFLTYCLTLTKDSVTANKQHVWNIFQCNTFFWIYLLLSLESCVSGYHYFNTQSNCLDWIILCIFTKSFHWRI